MFGLMEYKVYQCYCWFKEYLRAYNYLSYLKLYIKLWHVIWRSLQGNSACLMIQYWNSIEGDIKYLYTNDWLLSLLQHLFCSSPDVMFKSDSVENIIFIVKNHTHRHWFNMYGWICIHTHAHTAIINKNTALQYNLLHLGYPPIEIRAEMFSPYRPHSCPIFCSSVSKDCLTLPLSTFGNLRRFLVSWGACFPSVPSHASLSIQKATFFS